MLIPVALVSVMLMTGNFSHLMRPLFGFVSVSHAMQLLDPSSVLIVPCGQSIQSQQHGVVIAFLVPGRHSEEQKKIWPEALSR